MKPHETKWETPSQAVLQVAYTYIIQAILPHVVAGEQTKKGSNLPCE